MLIKELDGVLDGSFDAPDFSIFAFIIFGCRLLISFSVSIYVPCLFITICSISTLLWCRKHASFIVFICFGDSDACSPARDRVKLHNRVIELPTFLSPTTLNEGGQGCQQQRKNPVKMRGPFTPFQSQIDFPFQE